MMALKTDIGYIWIRWELMRLRNTGREGSLDGTDAATGPGYGAGSTRCLKKGTPPVEGEGKYEKPSR